MSFADGMAAINLETPPRVPRTEYSADRHWELVKIVTGIDINADSSPELREKAGIEFRRKWNYDFYWRTLINAEEFGDIRTKMGHASYESGGVDFSTDITSPFQDPEDVLNFDPCEAFGQKDIKELVKRFEENYAEACRKNPYCANMTGTYVTLMSGLIDLFGWDMLLMAAGLDPKRFGEVANRYAFWIQQYFEAMAESNVPIISVHDDIVWTEGAFLHPDWYRTFIFPNYKKMFAPLIESGKKIIYTSDGNYTQFINDIADCRVNGFVLEPCTDMKYIAEKYGKTHVFIGNADTRILLTGKKEDIHAEVQRCMDIGKNCPGFFMAVGNHIPANTPVENALYYNEIYEKLSKR